MSALNARRLAGRASKGFSLIEILVSVTLLLLLALLLSQITSFTSRMSQMVGGKSNLVQDGALALDTMNRKIVQSSLSVTGLDYYPDQSGSINPAPPEAYIRRSGLHFLTGYASNIVSGGSHPTHAIFFQAPLGVTNRTAGGYAGLSDMLNACGYFIEYGSNQAWIPDVLNLRQSNASKRFRLMELVEPSEYLGVYSYNGSSPTAAEKDKWIQSALTRVNSGGLSYYRPIADNVVALVVQPKYADAEEKTGNLDPISTDYQYDSRAGDTQISPSSQPPQPVQNNQLPPIIKITLVIIDEVSAKRLTAKYGESTPPLIDGQWFKSVNAYDSDMKALTDRLGDENLNYHVLVSEVPLRAAKWSTK